MTRTRKSDALRATDYAREHPYKYYLIGNIYFPYEMPASLRQASPLGWEGAYFILWLLGLVFDAYDDVGGFYYGVGFFAHFKSEILERSHGDGGRDNLTPVKFHDHDGIHCARMNGRDGPLQRVTCGQFHSNDALPSVCVPLCSLHCSVPAAIARLQLRAAAPNMRARVIFAGIPRALSDFTEI